MDIRDADTTELRQLRHMIDQELQRRDTLATAEAKATELNTAYLAAAGVEQGQDWRQPTSAVDAYPLDWTVTHGGKTWISLVAGNVWEPGVSAWREVVDDSGAPAEWVEPTGAHDAYNTGDQVTFEGTVYESVIDANTWSPSAYPAGWKAVP
ncbi:hypothetical protein [Brevibacterium sp. H-BE7]|uniref:hypothetical protein n=3 Tax=unclassified Brevibacterium TaxID=2614124 RepID=UPI00254CD7B7|nr:hypothetical protein [Brevibacterium sp. H-BE7]MDK8434289.1 hypothetical protein [Brevibacterium sp. H-BE7]